MDDAALRARRVASQTAWLSVLGRASDGAEVIELEGVRGSIVPARADRSIVNGVAYTDTGALLASLDALDRRFAEAGIEAWTVWVPDADRDAAGALEAAGHRLDGVPRDMGAVLDDMDLEPRAELERDADPTWLDIAEVNEAAYYGSSGGEYFGPALERLEARPHLARLDGGPACSVVILDADGDAYVQLVATRPEAQRRGLAGELLRLALNEARERGCTTTTLEATAAGAPVYARLGYRELGVVQMWERRVRNESA